MEQQQSVFGTFEVRPWWKHTGEAGEYISSAALGGTCGDCPPGTHRAPEAFGIYERDADELQHNIADCEELEPAIRIASALHEAAESAHYFARVRWHADDIMGASEGIEVSTGREVFDEAHRYFKTAAEARDWLSENEGAIQDAMVEAGWGVIEEILGDADDDGGSEDCARCAGRIDDSGEAFGDLCADCADATEPDYDEDGAPIPGTEKDTPEMRATWPITKED